MVGRKTSQRCDTCRQRKIKVKDEQPSLIMLTSERALTIRQCDLSTPSCSACVKAGWICPGYDQNAKFHHHVPKKTLPKARALPSPPTLCRLPCSPTASLRALLIDKSEHGQVKASFVVVWERVLLDHIPQRLGQDRALDDAVKLICTSSSLEDSVRAYGTALRSLQRSIDQGLSSENMTAATLLQMHDSFQKQLPSSAVHAEAVVRMLELRGADAICSDLDRGLLQAQIGNIAAYALKQGKACYLTQPKWDAILKSLYRREYGQDTNDSPEMSMMAMGVRFPGFIAQYEALMESGPITTSSGALDDQVRHLIAELGLLGGEMDHNLERAYDSLYDDRKGLDPPKSTIRIQPALMLAINVHLIMSLHMLGTMRGMMSSAIAGKVDTAKDDKAARRYADRAKSLYQQLLEVDETAAQSTARVIHSMFAKVYSVGRVKIKEHSSHPVYHEVLQMLSDASGTLCHLSRKHTIQAGT